MPGELSAEAAELLQLHFDALAKPRTEGELKDPRSAEQQRLALQAVDGGCTFPNCPMPLHWCQIDHTIDHAHGGPTRLDPGVTACGYHNRHSKAQGWTSTRINGRAAWIPPRWIDPDQKPRYNDLHRTEPP